MFADDASIVIMAGIMTIAVTAALTVYAFTTKKDFTWMGSLLWVFGTMGFLFFFFWIMAFWNNPVLNIMYNCFGVLLYSFYLIYDT